jgi:hypothetical protein
MILIRGQSWILPMIPTLNYIWSLPTNLHNQPPNLYCHHLLPAIPLSYYLPPTIPLSHYPQLAIPLSHYLQPVIPLSHLLQSALAFPIWLLLCHSTTTQSSLTVSVNLRGRCSTFWGTSRWLSLSYKTRSEKQISRMVGQANDVNLHFKQPKFCTY